MSTVPVHDSARSAHGATTRRLGYGFAIAINAVMLFVVDNATTWNIPWLTSDFDRVVPLLNMALIGAILANAVYLVFDPAWFKLLADTALLCLNLAATIAILRVFPFDFSGYAFDWTVVIRMVLILAVVAVTIGIIVNLVNLVRLFVAAGR